jgi:hypothetical protein
MKLALTVTSYVIGGVGAWAIMANTSPWVAIGVCLLIWSHALYQSATE